MATPSTYVQFTALRAKASSWLFEIVPFETEVFRLKSFLPKNRVRQRSERLEGRMIYGDKKRN